MRIAWLTLGLLAVAAAPAAGEEAPSRNAVWRAIFARPAIAPPALSDVERIALGHDLFRDTRLSGAGDRSCASCHDPSRAFTDGRATGAGIGGARLARNVPTLYNLAWGREFFWDGRAASLEAQARFPIEAADELAGDFPTVVARLRSDQEMAARFSRAFPGEEGISEAAILAALSTYERSLASGVAPFDHWVEGDDAALSAIEKEGFDLFVGKAGCVACHGGWRFTDDAFHDIGLAGNDPGRGAVAGGVPGLAQFKTPSLREVARTAPYMHDGSLPTLEAVVDHYAGKLVARPSLDANVVRDLRLSETERAALAAFLGSLSSDAELQQK